MYKVLIIILLQFVLISCSVTEDVEELDSNQLYFPPNDGSAWETIDFESLNWNENNLNPLYEFLAENNTRAFIVLKDGKIAIEKYWGNNILNTSTFDKETNWYWASAGKTLTATLVGIAQKESVLNINDKTSDYLGQAWTSLDTDKENLITIKNQLTMTTGLDYEVEDLNCTSPSCLEYKTDAGTQWYYHNAPYTLLEKVVSQATGLEYNVYTDQKIESVIGMDGSWITNGYNNVYWSSPRDMARFGLLTLNKGKWKDFQPLYAEDYFDEMINTSQNINLSYGYLWWLNGKSSVQPPGLTTPINMSLASNAPADLFAGIGKNGQFVDVIPSENLVVIRMGEAPDSVLVPIQFHNEMWAKLNAVMYE